MKTQSAVVWLALLAATGAASAQTATGSATDTSKMGSPSAAPAGTTGGSQTPGTNAAGGAVRCPENTLGGEYLNKGRTNSGPTVTSHDPGTASSGLVNCPNSRTTGASAGGNTAGGGGVIPGGGNTPASGR